MPSTQLVSRRVTDGRLTRRPFPVSELGETEAQAIHQLRPGLDSGTAQGLFEVSQNCLAGLLIAVGEPDQLIDR